MLITAAVSVAPLQAQTVSPIPVVATIYPGDTGVYPFAGTSKVAYVSLNPDLVKVSDPGTCAVKALMPGSALISAGGSSTNYGIVKVNPLSYISISTPDLKSGDAGSLSFVGDSAMVWVPTGTTCSLRIIPKKPVDGSKEKTVAYSDITYTASDNQALQFSTDGVTFQSPLSAGTAHNLVIKALKVGTYSVRIDSGGLSRFITVQSFQPQIQLVAASGGPVQSPLILLQHQTRTLQFQLVSSSPARDVTVGGTLSAKSSTPNVSMYLPEPNGSTISLNISGDQPGISQLTISSPNAQDLTLNVTVVPVVTDVNVSTKPLTIVEGDEVSVHVDYLDADHKLVKSDPPSNPDISYIVNKCSVKTSDRVEAHFAETSQTGNTAPTGNDLIISGDGYGFATIVLTYTDKTSGLHYIRSIPAHVVPQMAATMSPADETKSLLMFGRETCREFFIQNLVLHNNLDQAQSSDLANRSLTVYGNSMLADVLVQDASKSPIHNFGEQVTKDEFQFAYKGFSAKLSAFTNGEANCLAILYPPTLYPELSATNDARNDRDPGNQFVKGIGYVFQIAAFLNNAYPAGLAIKTNSWNPLRFGQDGSRISLYQTLINGFTSAFTNLKAKEGTDLTASFILTNTQTVAAGATLNAYVFFPKSTIGGVLPNRKIRIIAINSSRISLLYTIAAPAKGTDTINAGSPAPGGG